MDDQNGIVTIERGTRVEVSAPQGSTFNGERGTVTRLAGENVYVLLDNRSVALIFGRSELTPLAGGLLALGR